MQEKKRKDSKAYKKILLKQTKTEDGLTKAFIISSSKRFDKWSFVSWFILESLRPVVHCNINVLFA